jgi:hypothetical protein
MTELRKRGLLTAVVCSTPFMKLGQAQARTFGVPELPLIEIPHALGTLELGDVKERAERVVSELVRLIEEHTTE